MMKKILVAVLLAAPFLAGAQAPKFGTLNPSEIINVMPEMATAQNTLKEASDKYTAQGKVLQDEYLKKAKEYEDLMKAKAAEATITAKENELQDLQVRIQTFQQKAREDLERQQETLFSPIQTKLINAIQAVGAKGGYAAILDGSVLLYKGSDVEDISAKVKAELGIK